MRGLRGRSQEPEGSVHNPALHSASSVPSLRARSKSAGHRHAPQSQATLFATRPPPPPQFHPDETMGHIQQQQQQPYGPAWQRANVNQNVDPQQEFPSLRRGNPDYQRRHQRTATDRGVADSTTTVATAAAASSSKTSVAGEGDVIAYYFWVVMVFVFSISLVNFIVLLAVARVYNITPYSLDGVEFIPEARAVKFLREARLDTLHVASGALLGYRGEPFSLSSEGGGSVSLTAESEDTASELRVSPDSIFLSGDSTVKLERPEDSTGSVPDVELSNLDAVQLSSSDLVRMEASRLETNQIVSEVGRDLRVKSDSRLSVEGTEGVMLESRELEMSAGGDVLVSSDDGAVVLDADDRIVIDPRALPVGGAGDSDFFNLVAGGGLENQFKLCICFPSGLVFQVPVIDAGGGGGNFSSTSCGDRHLWEHDPCQTW